MSSSITRLQSLAAKKAFCPNGSRRMTWFSANHTSSKNRGYSTFEHPKSPSSTGSKSSSKGLLLCSLTAGTVGILTSAYVLQQSTTTASASTQQEEKLLDEKTIDQIIRKNEVKVQVNSSKSGGAPISEYHINSYAANAPVEDRHNVVIDPKGSSYFLVADGHSGTAASEFAKNFLIQYVQWGISEKLNKQNELITQQKEFFSQLVGLSPEEWSMVLKGFADEGVDASKLHALQNIRDTFDIIRAVPISLEEAFFEADGDFLALGVVDSKRMQDGYSGACLNMATIMGNLLFVANAGDCRAILGKMVQPAGGAPQLQAIPMSSDHTADREEKRLRSEHPNEPDVVTRGRVKGRLQPSRGLGDGLYKEKFYSDAAAASGRKLPPNFNPPYTTVLPEVAIRYLNKDDKFVVLATDGLWENLTNEEVVEVVGQHLSNPNKNKENASTALIKRSLEKSANRGSTPQEKLSHIIQLPQAIKRRVHDDITVVVVFLDQNRLSNVSGNTWIIPKQSSTKQPASRDEIEKLATEYMKKNPDAFKDK